MVARTFVASVAALLLTGTFAVTGCGPGPEDGNDAGVDAGRDAGGGNNGEKDAGVTMDAGTGTDAGMGCDPMGATVSFANDIQPIFNSRCTACHTGGAFPSGGLSLIASNSYDALVDQDSTLAACGKRVVPGDPDQSLLYLKIRNMQPAGCGVAMPQGTGGLTVQAELDAIRDWILECAQNN